MSSPRQSGTDLQISEASSSDDIQRFLDYPFDLYKGQPNWHPPLRFERKDHLSTHKNPVARLMDRQFFLARRGNDIVGRIAAFINPVHQKHYDDCAGHFGFFDCEPHPDTGRALLATAENWLATKSCKKMIGPASHSVNEECGLLIDGFDTPPVLMMPYGRPDYQNMYEDHGLTKAIDMLAFWADLNAGYPRPKMTASMVEYARKDPEITFRKMRRGALKSEVSLAREIFNDAWADNWGFLPFSEEQIQHMGAEMKPLIFREGFRVGMVKGEPVAFIWMIPNLNEAIRDLDGKLLPFGWAKLVSRLKISGVKTSRIPLMGLKKDYQRTRQGLSIVAALCEDVFAAGRKQGYSHCELSWILEDNKSMIRICEQASAVPYKTYRMFEKTIGQ